MTALSIIIDIILILVSLALIVAVLMQQGQRQGLGAIGGGAETFFGKNAAGTVEGKLKDMIFTIGENMNIRRFLLVDGVVSTYIHGKGTTGVIIKFEADDVCASNPGFAEFAKNIALQVAAMPAAFVRLFP